MELAKVKVKDLFQDDHLEHYGILGMKWGVRRYQNEDGTLTAAGKARRSDKQVKENGKKGEYDSGSKKWKMKDARHLSDEELNRRNSRLQREKQYRDLTEPPIRKETRQILKKIFIGTAVGAATAMMAVKYKDMLMVGGQWINSAMAKEFMKHAAKAAGAAWVL